MAGQTIKPVHMVQKKYNVMALMDVIAHPYNLRRKRREIQP